MKHSTDTLRAAFASAALIVAIAAGSEAQAAIAPIFLQEGSVRVFVSPSPTQASDDCLVQSRPLTDEYGELLPGGGRLTYIVFITAIGPNCWYFM